MESPNPRPRGALARGERVFLRPPEAEDREEFLTAMRQSRGLYRPWVMPPLDGPAWEAYLARTCRPGFVGLLACLREGGAIAGVFNLSEIVRGVFQSAYLGYYAVAPFAGRGYMTEGLHLVLRHTFEKLKLHRLEANIQPGNRASIALAARCGFVREGYSPRYLKIGGRWRDHERWAITREGWLGSVDHRRQYAGH
jgi:ribosomal-protein-alanine N-acetyltransferase